MKIYTRKKYNDFIIFCAKRRLKFDTYHMLSDEAKREVVDAIDKEYQLKGEITIVEGVEEMADES